MTCTLYRFYDQQEQHRAPEGDPVRKAHFAFERQMRQPYTPDLNGAHA